MKKGIRLLAMVSASALLFSGCGASLYELTDDEETLITQYAAYAVGRHNIRQKDGMNATRPQEEDSQKSEPESTQQEPKQDNGQNSGNNTDSSGGTKTSTDEYATVSLAEAVGYDSVFDIAYKGYELLDTYKEGNYFSVNAAADDTLLVMKFTISNRGDKDAQYDTSSLSNTFYGVFDGQNKIAEKRTFSNEELSSGSKTIKAGAQADAIMIFEISKKQAVDIKTKTLLVDMKGTTYQVKL